MIKTFDKKHIDDVMKIWIDTNIKAHHFIADSYWLANYDAAKTGIMASEIYVYQNQDEIIGFVGLSENYIAGIFVLADFQSKGIGKKLLDYVKRIKSTLTLSVYEKNTKAVKFYQREGFTIAAENMDDETNEKELAMLWQQ